MRLRRREAEPDVMSREYTDKGEGDGLKKFSIFNFQFSMFLSGALFLALSLAAIWGFLALFPPKPYASPLKPFSDYSLDAMQAEMAPDAVREQLDEVAALGNRFLGKKGFYNCGDLIRRRYTEAGLKLYEQAFRIVAPQSEFAEALSSDGLPAGFNIYPFMPNHYQPIATPDEGITATVLRIDESLLRTRRSFRGCFALLDGSLPPPLGYGYNYARYAQLGFEGVIVSHPDGLSAVPWDQLNGITSRNPVNFVRVAADAGVFDSIGKEITLRVRVRYRGVPNRTLIGVMEGDGDAEEALIIPCSYDALSMLPDHSPGLMQALPVAIQLQLLKGLQPYRDSLRRDVIFIAFGGRAMAQDPQVHLLSVIGAQPHQQARRSYLESKQAMNAMKIQTVSRCIAVLAQPGVMVKPDATRDALASLDRESRDFLKAQVQYVLDACSLKLSETVLQAKIAFEKGNTRHIDRPEFAAYQAAKKQYDRSFSAAGFEPVRLLSGQAEYALEIELRRRVTERVDELKCYHEEQAVQFAQGLVLNTLFTGYSKLVVFSPEMAVQEDGESDAETLSFCMGYSADHSNGGQPAYDAIRSAIQKLKLDERVTLRYNASKSYGSRIAGRLAGTQLESEMWSRVGYPAYSLVNLGRPYKVGVYPVVLPWMRDMESISGGLEVFGAVVLSLGYGNGAFMPLEFQASRIADFRGNIFVANAGQSIIPSHPLAGALVGCKGIRTPPNGRYSALLNLADPYGHYERPYCMGQFAPSTWDYGPDAVGYDATGVINYIKDEGPKSQRIFLSMHLSPECVGSDVNVVCYRADPVTLLDLINPQSLKSYAGAAFIRKRGLNAFDSFYVQSLDVVAAEGMFTTFVAPNERFYVELKAGASDNELVQTTRAFLLGREERDGEMAGEHGSGSEIRGQGYLAAETPLIRNVASEVARSMISVNSKRLAVQDHYGMADVRTLAFQQRAVECLAEAEDTTVPHKLASLSSRDAVTYSTLNHPILRANISEAVAGILWYLGLLVPFAFFFEKLTFGFSDVRKQLGAHVVIFLVAFMLLKVLHPAFAMIRSSVMILLGFVILMISTGILAMFSSKFKENLEGLKKQRGQVTAAEVNKFGAIVTAFMLGLNNMHRRRVRTMLTCGTLVLITFVMICFTSVQSDIVDSSVSIGKAPFQGFVIKNEQYRRVSGSEQFALETKYGESYAVVARRAMLGTENWITLRREYPDLTLVRRDDTGARTVKATSILTLSPEEPLAKFLVPAARWFVKEDALASDDPVPLLISKAMASKLGIVEEMLTGDSPVTLEVNGTICTVRGIFDGTVLDGLLDFDGYNLLPYDIKALREVNKSGKQIIAEADDPRISGDDVIIAPRSLGVYTASGSDSILSVAVVLPDTLPPKEAREEIEQFMEQSGRRTYYGLDGFAFLGKRARASSFVGLVDMLIPLIIAAITVLNTIRGSVYERKEEIFVYNAVGIAPKHIFFMFFAEAFVYAVVGSVLGYILSQGTGKLLTALNLTGGLNMTFTTLGTIYASWAIAGSVFISTWFPARTAMKIAAPSDDVGWSLPQPDGDRLTFKLPFTFDWHDRIAVLAFFRRYFTDHGEGSSGPFFTGLSGIGVSDKMDPLNNDGYIPTINTPIWLKPFDLGVSQDLLIAMPTDTETGEFVAEITITRGSGTLENWKRLNRHFVGLLRTHFLHWRAVAPDERVKMFAEAREALKIRG